MDPAIAEARARMIAKRFGGNAAGANADGIRRNKKAASKPVNAGASFFCAYVTGTCYLLVVCLY
jgi:hypothetical protein